MPNEVLLLISLVLSYGLMLLAFRFIGKIGIYAWIAICTILANIEVTVLVVAFGMEQTLGNTLFAASFLATDILSECYGKKESEKGVYVGVFSSLSFIVFALLWQQYTPSENDWAYPYVQALFSNTPRMLLSSLFAYVVSEYIDVQLYHFIWNKTEKKSGNKRGLLWVRNNGSTLISQFINIFIFNFGAFLGIYDMKTLCTITLSCYVIYVFTSLLDTPFIYIARAMKEKYDL